MDFSALDIGACWISARRLSPKSSNPLINNDLSLIQIKTMADVYTGILIKFGDLSPVYSPVRISDLYYKYFLCYVILPVKRIHIHFASSVAILIACFTQTVPHCPQKHPYTNTLTHNLKCTHRYTCRYRQMNMYRYMQLARVHAHTL